MRRPTSTLLLKNLVQLGLSFKEVGIVASFFFNVSKRLSCLSEVGLVLFRCHVSVKDRTKNILIKDIAVRVDATEIVRQILARGWQGQSA